MTLDTKLVTYEGCKTEAEAVQESLAQVGINVEIEILGSRGTLFRTRYRRSRILTDQIGNIGN